MRCALAHGLVFLTAFAGTSSLSSAQTAGPSAELDTGNSTQLSEVVVTAQKRSERLQDVPTSVTAIDASTLLATQALNLRDYFATVPGLAINDQGNGRVSLDIRGVSTGDGTNPTVGVTIDDVPIGASNAGLINGSGFVPQLDPSELTRVEVLKGPQGTLYGASTLGGLFKYVTAPPDLKTASGRVEVDGSSVDGGGVGFGARAGVTVPLVEDLLAVRVSAFDRTDPGFIDDPLQGRNNVNTVHVHGGRVALLWQMSSNTSFTVADLVQKTNGDGSASVDTNYLYQPLYGDLTHEDLRGADIYNYQINLLTGNLNVHLPGADITSVTGYQIDRDLEARYFPSENSFALSQYGVDAAMLYNQFATVKFSQEVRVASSGHSKLDWLLGAFFTNENNGDTNQPINAIDRATGASVGEVLNYYYPDHYKEWAAFADVTYHFTDQFDVQVGGRESTNEQVYHEVDSGPAIGPIDNVINEHSKDSSFTYLVTPRYRLSDSLMMYARLATGYRPGGPNTLVTGVDVPPTYKPDKTRNYELGVKSEFLDRRASLDAAVFYVDWSDIQLTVNNPVLSTYYLGNAGTAKSQGFELSGALKPLEGLTLSLNTSYTDAQLTQTVGTLGASGDRLPYSAKVNVNLAIEDQFSITQSVDGFAGLSSTRVGDRIGNFGSGPGAPRLRYPAYATVDLHGGFDVNKFKVTAFVKNLGNKRGILGSGTRESEPYTTTAIYSTAIIVPRTVGLSVSKEF